MTVLSLLLSLESLVIGIQNPFRRVVKRANTITGELKHLFGESNKKRQNSMLVMRRTEKGSALYRRSLERATHRSSSEQRQQQW